MSMLQQSTPQTGMLQGYRTTGFMQPNMVNGNQIGYMPQQPQRPMPPPAWAQNRGYAVSGVQPGADFYNYVTQLLGQRQQARPGDYAGGWNQESSPNSRAQAQADAQTIAQALGRPLSREEFAALNQRAQGWGFQAPTFNPNWAQFGQSVGAY